MTGSTRYIITKNSRILAEIPFSTIIAIIPDPLDPLKLKILSTIDIYNLTFLTEFDRNQAYSRMLFVVNEPFRYLTPYEAYWNNSGFTGVDLIPPVIDYNISGATNYFHYYHSGQSGWTLADLSAYFISGVTDWWDGIIPTSAVTLKLNVVGSIEYLTGITHEGIYNLQFEINDNAGNFTTGRTINYVDDTPPHINYYDGVVHSYISGNTTEFSGVTSGITSGTTITEGFAFNISGFTDGKVTRQDIIDNIVESVVDDVDPDLNKYMLDVLIVNSTEVLTEVVEMGEYCVKLSISDKNGNTTVKYLKFILTNDAGVSCFSSGFWRDERVWVDSTFWVD